MGGRVKTLHPKLYAGLLALRDDPEHMVAAEEHEIEFVDLVCVNLYPFERTAGAPRRDRARGDREHRHRRPDDDPRGGEELRVLRGRGQARRATTRCCRSSRDADGQLSLGTRESLAAEAFSYTARYDTRDRALVRREAGRLPAAADVAPTRRSPTSPTARTRTSAPPTTRRSARACTCSRWCASSAARSCRSTTCSTSTPARLLVAGVRAPGLRDHQAQQPVRRARSAARRSRPTSAPSRATRCRRSAASSASTAGRRARSPRRSLKQFCEVLFAPRFTDEALEVLAAKPNMRILEDDERRRVNIAERDLKRVMGGLLVQDRDIDLEDRTEMEVVTERKPTEAEWGEMLFAWKVCKHVRSNAIVLVQATSRRSASAPGR